MGPFHKIKINQIARVERVPIPTTPAFHGLRDFRSRFFPGPDRKETLMAKRTTMETDQQPSGKEIRTPADQTVKVFNSTFDDVKATVDDANEELKTAADEAKKKHLHLSSFKDVKKLYDAFKRAKNQSIAAEKLAAYLANFDKLRKYFKLDEHANLQGRMFGEGEIGSSADVNGVPRDIQEDGEPDDRPTHLRQPGASAASVVQDLASKTGAKTQDPIDQVGRGPKPH